MWNKFGIRGSPLWKHVSKIDSEAAVDVARSASRHLMKDESDQQGGSCRKTIAGVITQSSPVFRMSRGETSALACIYHPLRWEKLWNLCTFPYICMFLHHRSFKKLTAIFLSALRIFQKGAFKTEGEPQHKGITMAGKHCCPPSPAAWFRF